MANSAPHPLSAWLQLLRISNLPTILSNVLAGAALAVGPANASSFPWSSAAGILPSMAALYLAGMIMNDLADLRSDRQERPERPLAKRQISPRAAAMAMSLLLVGGVGCAWLMGWKAGLMALGLTGLITLYNLAHLRTALSVLFLGACRSMVYLTSAAVIAWPLSWPVGIGAAVIGAYVIVLSLLARHEAGNPKRLRLVIFLLCGISLVDSAVLAVCQLWLALLVGLACFALTIAAQRHVKGT